MTMFKDGDFAIKVHQGRWSSDRDFTKVEINKVHKSGRLTIKGSNQQWRLEKGWGDQPDYFLPCNGYYSERLYPWCERMVSEIRAEQKQKDHRLKLNKVGNVLSGIRDNDNGAELWALLPTKIKELIKEET